MSAAILARPVAPRGPLTLARLRRVWRRFDRQRRAAQNQIETVRITRPR